MDITKRQNLLVLWKESFSVVNRAAFPLLAVVVLFIVFFGGVGFGLSLLIKNLLPAGQWILIGLAAVVCFLLFFVSMSYGSVIFWRILETTAQRAPVSLGKILASSFKPAIYCIFGQILWMIAMLAVTFAINLIDNQILQAVVNLLFALGVTIRMVYALLAIALRDQGPIDGFIYSWNLTGKNYVDTLLMCLLNVLFPLVMFLFVGICLYLLYIGIPLYFADSFDITHLTWPWFAVLGLIVLGCVFIATAMLTFPLIVFVNRDYDDSKLGKDVILEQNAELRPLRPENNVIKEHEPEPLFIDHAPSADIGPEKIPLSTSKKEDEEPLVDVLQATFRTEQKPQQVQEQLQKVYKPKASTNEVIEYSEEDRMPTIVFDEQMTRQLEENRKLWQNEPKDATSSTNNTPTDDGGTVRRSK